MAHKVIATPVGVPNKLVELTAEEEKVLTVEWEANSAAKEREIYKERRQAEYPSIADQLDMIYLDKVNGTNLWVDEITRIKEKYPKPGV